MGFPVTLDTARNAIRVTQAGGPSGAMSVLLTDPITGVQVTVAQFHNADGQALPATAYGLLTGGVAQLLNGAGSLDRARAAFADSVAPTGIAFESPALWNGTTFDRERSNYSQSLKSDFLIGAGITSGATFTNYNARGVIFSLIVSAASGTNPTLGVQIQGQNADGQWFNLPGAAFAAQTAAGGCIPLYVEPGAASTANLSVNFRVPRSYRAVYSVGGTAVPSFTFLLDADYCL